jgi:RNA polymerase sigma factor (sigma-70 family)
MGNGLTASAAIQVARVFRDGTLAGMSDRQILERFVERRDESAFEAILYRHGAMVRNVCRQMLFDPHEVDEAVQSVFLVLVRKARFIRIEGSLGPWLYAVAGRVAARARANRRKRWARECQTGEMPETSYASTEDAFELSAVIHDELGRLPERLRSPLVLCYLEGLTHDLAARQLDCPVGTLRSRLARARNLLHWRLARRGLTLSAAALGGMLGASARAANSPRLTAPLVGSIKRAMLEAVRQNGLGLPSSFATTLEGVLSVSRIKKIVVLAAAIPAAVMGLALVHTTVVGQTPVPRVSVSSDSEDDRGLSQQGKQLEAAPARSEKSKQVDLPAEPIDPYLLTKDAGPFMVLARVFRGPDARRLAIALAKELRDEYGLRAYILRKGDVPPDRVRGVPPAGVAPVMGPDGKLPEKIRTFDEAAVLVGDEKSPADQLRLWSEVKKIQPKCLEQLAAAFPWRKGLSTALRTMNPLVPGQNVAARDRDNLVKRMNAGPRSILNCTGRFSLLVAEFSGRSSNNAHDQAEETAEKLAAAPEDWSLGQQVYVFHDRASSAVFVGSFDSFDDPMLNILRKHLIRDVAILIRSGQQAASAAGVRIEPGPKLIDVNKIKAKVSE